MLIRIAMAVVAALISLSATTGTRAATLAEMAGQMILAGFQGDSVNSAGVAAAREDIAAGRLGGVMFLRTNVTSLNAVKAINQSFMSTGASLPPLIAIDQEGGSVERLTEAVGFTEIPSAATLSGNGNLEAAMRVYSDLAQRLHGLGFNLNFGPVVDLATNPSNPVIVRFGRSYGAAPIKVRDYSGAFLIAHRSAHVLTALKHFPGHGSSTTDSHEGFTDISTSWDPQELLPYQELFKTNMVDMVMVGHLFNSNYESGPGQELPASLSPLWINHVLRSELGFDGVVISDDMEMGAIRENYGWAEAIKMAVMAGTDILLFSNTANARPGLAREVQAILVEAGQADPAFAARIQESYGRIVAMKQRIL